MRRKNQPYRFGIKITEENFGELDPEHAGYVNWDQGKVLTPSTEWIGTDGLGSCLALIVAGRNQEGQAMAGLWHFTGHQGKPTATQVFQTFQQRSQQLGCRIEHFYAIGGCAAFQQIKNEVIHAAQALGIANNTSFLVDLTEDEMDSASTSVRIDHIGPNIRIRYWTE